MEKLIILISKDIIIVGVSTSIDWLATHFYFEVFNFCKSDTLNYSKIKPFNRYMLGRIIGLN